MSEQLVPLRTFSLADRHYADNLADFLDSQGIESNILWGQLNSVAEEEAVLVAVPNSQLLRARKLAEVFMADYEASVDALVAKQPKADLGSRWFVALYLYVFPALLLGVALVQLYKALFWRGDDGQPYPWSDAALGEGIVTLLAAGLYVGFVVYVRRRPG